MSGDGRARLRFITALVADDIRREASGKNILIGVYGQKLVVPRVGEGVRIRLACSLLYNVSTAGTSSVQLRIIGPDGTVAGEGTIEIVVVDVMGEHEIGAIDMPSLPVSLPTEGKITIDVKQYDEDWQTIRSLPILVDPDHPVFTSGAASHA